MSLELVFCYKHEYSFQNERSANDSKNNDDNNINKNYYIYRQYNNRIQLNWSWVVKSNGEMQPMCVIFNL